MKKHRYAFALGMLVLLIVLGAEEARAQLCIATPSPPAQYVITLGGLGEDSNTSLTHFVLGGFRIAGQNQLQPINGGGFLVRDNQNNSLLELAIHEAIAEGAGSNPAATTRMIFASQGSQQRATYTRREYGGASPQPPTSGNLANCPRASQSLSQLFDN